MKRILCIWLPNWPIQRRVVERPELKSQPLVIHAEHRGRGHRVVACNALATEAGVQPSIPLAEAKSLGTIREFHLHDPAADHTSLEKLAYWCEQFSPIVGIEEADEPSSLLLDITGLELVYRDESSLAHLVAEKFQQQGYDPRIAIADTLGAAWAVAHHAPSNFSEEERSFVIPNGMAHETLATLPIEALRLPNEAVNRFHQLGIVHIEQLMLLPRESLPSRFGDEVLLRIDQAAGIKDEVIVPHRPPPKLTVETPLEYSITKRSAIKQVLAELIENLCQRLAAQNHGAVRLECRLDCEQTKTTSEAFLDFQSLSSNKTLNQQQTSEVEENFGSHVRIEVGFFQPTASSSDLLELAFMRFERVSLSSPVARVQAAVTLSAPLERRQAQLFDDSANDRPRQLAQLINRLSGRLGEQNVIRPRQQAGAMPEHAHRDVILTGQPKRTKPSQAKLAGPLQRPLHLELSPIPLDVISLADDGAPALFHDEFCTYRIEQAWGPERIETQWWRGKLVRRDYYRVETETGARFWIFRRLQDRKWFLHGSFD